MAALVGVLAAVALDTWTEFGTTRPVTADFVAGVLGLPVSGVAAALAVDYVLKQQRRRDWGSVHAHVLTDVLPLVRGLFDAVARCRPGEDTTIREVGEHVMAGLRCARHGAGQQRVRAADLPEHLTAAMDQALELLGEFDERPVLERYDMLSTAFPDLDLLDDPGVKLAVLSLRRSAVAFHGRAQGVGRHYLSALRELRSGRGTWDGQNVHYGQGSIALTVDGAGQFFMKTTELSLAARELEERAWELALAVQEAVGLNPRDESSWAGVTAA